MADLGFLEVGDFKNPTRTEGVWANRKILCICELERTEADTVGDRDDWTKIHIRPT